MKLIFDKFCILLCIGFLLVVIGGVYFVFSWFILLFYRKLIGRGFIVLLGCLNKIIRFFDLNEIYEIWIVFWNVIIKWVYENWWIWIDEVIKLVSILGYFIGF